MASPSLGVKRHCQSCGNNYYDLNKSPITCPMCQAHLDP
ncbi:MAG: FYDLN acid domain-containing protein, partial [Alphaproteobacteria bacterium]|nr:FYDLN acid domain-containing protein [Alphaproteobacteria bacterium]